MELTNLVDAHTHTFLRGPEDLEAMAASGVRHAVVCAFLPVPPSGAASLLDLFRWMEQVEAPRLAAHGVQPVLAMGIHPRSIPPQRDVEAVLSHVEAQAAKGGIRAIGEIGLETGSDEERAVLVRQLAMAARLRLPAIVHTPRKNKDAILERTLAAIDESGIPDGQVILDHLTAPLVLSLDRRGRKFRMGMTIQPSKTTPQEVFDLVRNREGLGTERLHLDSDLSHVASWPDAVARAAAELAFLGMEESDVLALTGRNAVAALGLQPA